MIDASLRLFILNFILKLNRDMGVALALYFAQEELSLCTLGRLWNLGE